MGYGIGEVYTAGQAARIMGTSSTWIWKLAQSGRIKSIKTPLGNLYDAADVRRLSAERQTEAGA